MLHRILSMVLLAGATATLSAQSNVSFELANNSVPDAGGATVAGDFNGDGKLDLAWSSDVGTPNNILPIFVQLGIGDGTFQAPRQIGSIPNGAEDLQAADLNGDGKLDLIAVTIVSNPRLYVWFGNGDGTFQTPQTYSTNDLPYAVTAGNFFGDGHLDIAVGEEYGNVDLFRNTTGSSFALAKQVNLGGSDRFVTRVRAGNFNGNGIADIAAITDEAAWMVWSDGKGGFSPVELSTYAEPPSDLNVSRLNNDGRDDAIVTYTCKPAQGQPENACAGFDVYYGQGNDTTTKQTAVTDSGVYAVQSPWGVDVNGDGIGDLVGLALLPNSEFGLFVWLGNADGSFQQTPKEFPVTTDGATGTLVAGDFNRDGMIDLLGSGEFFLNATEKAPCGTYSISPSVTVCQPVDNTYVNSPVRVEANSYDTTKVTAMQEYVNGSLAYSQPVTRFNTTFSEAPGAYQFVTKAWDTSGRSFIGERNITVYSGTPGKVCSEPTPNTAAICIPSGETTDSPVTIVANGYTLNIPTAAQLYIDGDLAVNNHVTGDSYAATTQNLSGGSHTLVFKLWDADGNVYSATKTITVN